MSSITAQEGGAARQNLCDRMFVAAFEGTFPDDHNAPALIREGFDGARITRLVCRDLGLPELLSCGWEFEEMAVMAVPEAAMGENHSVKFRKDQIR